MKLRKMAVLFTALTALLLPCGAVRAEEEIVHIDFDDGGLDGFTTYVNTGDCDLSNDDGRLAVRIRSCGSLDYANQAYWDGFSLEQGCEYIYSFDISCDITRDLYYRLQLNGGDYHAYETDLIEAGPEVRHISTEWTMTEETDPAPRLVFNMGVMDSMEQDPGEHTVYIDNISLIRKTDPASSGDEPDGQVTLSLNQAGYRPDDEKTAFLRTDTARDVTWVVIDEEGDEYIRPSAEEPFYDEAAGGMISRVNLTPVREAGHYTLLMQENGATTEEASFTVEDNPYEDLTNLVFRMLSLQRCGTETGAADSAFHHGACHQADALVYGTDERRDVSGGWHDAGDYGRYVVPGAKAVLDLFIAFEHFGFDRDDLGIPESGNGIPDALDEARCELDWMLKMQDEATGGVSHKVTCRQFPGEVMPEDETDELVLAPVSGAATADFAAVMAKASVLYREIDPAFAQLALKRAELAWEYLKAHERDGGFTNPQDISTGEYPDEDLSDELFTAAAELFLAGSLSEEELSAFAGQEYGGGFGWQDLSGYGLTALAFGADVPEKWRSRAVSALTARSDEVEERIGEDGYHVAFGTAYPWGSNMAAANNGMLLLLAGEQTGDETDRALAKAQLDYLLGANANGYCFVTGIGELTPKHPHHRPSQAAGEAMPGMLVGGPDSFLEDPYAANVLKDLPPALCYADNAQSYSTNEVAIYWNSPLIALLAGINR